MIRGAYTAGAVVMAAMLAWAAEAQTPGKWVKLAAFPEPAEEVYGATAGGKMYVFGGLAPGWKPRGLVFEYDPATNTWTKKRPMPLASHHLAVVELNGKIYVIGGRTGAAFISVGTNTDVVEEYDPATDTWGAPKARMPTPRSAVAYATYKDRIYIAGGEFQDEKLMAAFWVVEAYHPASNSWATLPRMPIPRHGLAGAVIGNRLHLVTGEIQSAGIPGAHLASESHDAFEFEAQ